MVVAAIVEIKRLEMIKDHKYYERDTIPMIIFWQVPQYFLVGAAEVFTFIGQLGFFYDQVPDAIQSLMSAISLTTVALDNYLSTFLVPL